MSIVIRGHVRVWKDGKLILEGRNRVVDAGLQLVAQIFSATAQPRVKAMAFGTNPAAPTGTQTKLSGTERGRRRVSVLQSSAQITYTATIVGVTQTLKEFGLFNATAATSGAMLARWPSSEIPMASNSSLRVAWSIQFGTG